MRLFILILASLGFMAVPRLLGPAEPTIGVQSAADSFAAGSKTFAASCASLRQALEAPPKSTQAIQLARQRLIDCRYHYKQIESFLEYFFRSSASIYNKPPKYEPEEPDMEYQPPAGLQLIEALLYEKHPDQKALLEQAKAVESAASDLPALLYEFKATDRQLLESLRIELVRIIALDITGYEAPLLKTGIQESLIALQTFSSQLHPYLQQGDSRSDSLRLYIEKATALLQDSKDFDSFDRLNFLKQAALPLQRQLSLFIHEKDLCLNTAKALNYDAGDIFNPDILKPAPSAIPDNSSNAQPDPATIALGRKLFFNTALSTNHQKSCASCHDPSKYFTDGLAKSLAFDNHHSLDRNAPSLLYSSYQYSQFWDGRAKTLEDQIRTVLHDAREMNADTTSLQKLGGVKKTVTALAAYIRSLHPMNSRFDQYLRDNAPQSNTPTNAPQSNTSTSPQAHIQILTPREIAGANLFMGKAQCATCHFIPLFNGLIPPYYELTEFEILGTTTTDKFTTTQPHQNKPNQAPTSPLHLSPDIGRYSVYPLPFLKGAFKTPTVRNSANTAPYMHNGAFHSLETVLDFYNKGGGAGLGLNVPDQTLSPSPLNLSKTEISDIILFIHTLTDNLNEKP